MKKIKYEKPTSLDAGQIAAIQGASCSNGYHATSGCIGGTDPQVAPVCQPGLLATYNCTVGTTNTDGNCGDGGIAHGLCAYTGSTPG